MQRRQRAHALAHVLEVGGDVIEHGEEFLREKVGVCVDAHGRVSPYLLRVASTGATAAIGDKSSGAFVLKQRENLGGDRLRSDALRVGCVAGYPHARLEAFDRERAGLGDPVLELEARSAAFHERGLDRHLVAEPRRLTEARSRFDQRMAGEVVGLEIVDLVHAEGALDENGRAGVENFEIARIEDDSGGVAIAPFDA